MKKLSIVFAILSLFISAPFAKASSDPLPSWNTGATKQSIVDFVEAVTKQGSKDYVPPEERVATFDNDGTLWCEQPIYTQMVFATDQAKRAVAQHPELKDKPPYKAIMAGDPNALIGLSPKSGLEFIQSTHGVESVDAFENTVESWIEKAMHPRFKHVYTECVYQPMLELLSYLRDNGFKTYIVSGGGTEFMRPWTERVYGVPPEKVIGSDLKMQFQDNSGKVSIQQLPEAVFVTDRGGKPVAIESHIGRHPIAAFGNSDGDLEMLQWTAARKGRHLSLIVHHTDAVREYAYDRTSKIGHLDKALTAAQTQGWTIVDMKNDWSKIFPFDK